MKRRGYYWPSADHLLLLRAALLPDDAALAAWREWRVRVDVDSADLGTQRLLPLLAHNLSTLGAPASELARFTGMARHAWAVNQRHLLHSTAAVAALEGDGIRVALLGGVALAEGYYEHSGLRRFDAVDVLVRHADASRACRRLRTLGWEAPIPDPPLDAAGTRRFLHRGGACLRLHWHGLWEVAGAADDSELWTRADATTFGRTNIVALSPADLLWQLIVDGARWHSTPPVQWIADAIAVLSSRARPVDWSQVVAAAGRYRIVLPVRTALAFLREALGAAVPANVIDALDAHRSSPFERFEQRMREWTSPALGRFPLVVCHHMRVSRADGVLLAAWKLPRYLQYAYEVPTLAALPAALCGRAIRRLRRTPPRRQPFA